MKLTKPGATWQESSPSSPLRPEQENGSGAFFGLIESGDKMQVLLALVALTAPVLAQQPPINIMDELGEQIDRLLRADSWTDRIASFPSTILQTISNASAPAPPPGCVKPPNFPLGIKLKQVDFINWAEQLSKPSYWAAEPETPDDVAALANWAWRHGYTLRPRGYMHSWAPITLTASSPCTKTLLVDTIPYLNTIRMLPQNASSRYPNQVLVYTGASWESLLTYLEDKSFGIFSFPAVGQMTLGGTLAVGAHGTGVPTRASKLASGFRSGSISSLITSLTAVVWSHQEGAYVLRTFQREDEDIRVFMVHLGRAFVTSVTLMVGQNYNLRCQSITNIRADQLFSRDHDNEYALATFVDNYDRVEAQFFPYTDKTWLKLWTEEKTRGVNSQHITEPYPYTHGRQVFRPVDRLIQLLASGIVRLTPVISRMTYELGVSGVALTRTADVWGPSKNSLLYYHHLAHKFISLGYTVLTSRPNLQKVVNLSYLFYSRLSEEMSNGGKYPMNQPLEFRITGLDRAETDDSGEVIGKPPSISFLSEVEGHPEYDIALFLGLHYFPGTPYAAEFMRDWESFLFSTFNGQFATARVEWAKTWGFDAKNSWVNETVYRDYLPRTFGSEWNYAVGQLDHYDPHGIYTNEFLERLMTPVV